MCGRVTISLAVIPRLLKQEYHPDQVILYSKFTELMYKALNLPSVATFTEKLAAELGIKRVVVLVNRLPARRSKVDLVLKEGRVHLVREQLEGISKKTGALIIVWPGLLCLQKGVKPFLRVGIRGYMLNSTIRALIHELLHQSGVHDEAEARRLADQHYKEFRQTHLIRFEEELKPILKEWKEMEKEMGLR
jgi:hypothetical protein